MPPSPTFSASFQVKWTYSLRYRFLKVIPSSLLSLGTTPYLALCCFEQNEPLRWPVNGLHTNRKVLDAKNRHFGGLCRRVPLGTVSFALDLVKDDAQVLLPQFLLVSKLLSLVITHRGRFNHLIKERVAVVSEPANESLV